jgi:uncharacterized protein YtpQ (UPF0354 family)
MATSTARAATTIRLKARLTPQPPVDFTAPPDWPRRLRLPVLRETQLTDIVVEALSHRLPDCRVEPSGDLEATITTRRKAVLTAQLGPLHSTLVGCEPEERLAELEPFLKSLIDAARALDVRGRKRRRDRVVPLIKDDSFFDQIDPGFRPAAERLVGDLSIVYAFDRPRSLDIMTEAERVALGVPVEELRALAVRNLRRLVPEIRHHESGTGYVLLAGGNFEASLLLLDDLWVKLSADIKGELVACAPARDMILYTGSATPGAVEDLRELAARVITEGGYSLSGTLLRWTGMGWDLYRPSERPH